ncbi:hypothetical protein F5B21DRAFT_493205 [Xylaria acuta]|nr:hypothetical protein F5B21DRAFT_493205 [Xylaria acuta]
MTGAPVHMLGGLVTSCMAVRTHIVYLICVQPNRLSSRDGKDVTISTSYPVTNVNIQFVIRAYGQAYHFYAVYLAKLELGLKLLHAPQENKHFPRLR